MRALSPGVNEPFTATACVNWLSTALGRAAEREMPSRCSRDKQGQLRVIAKAPSFEGMVEASFNQTRQYGSTSVAATIRLLEAITDIATHVWRDEDRAVLTRQAGLIKRDSDAKIQKESDRADFKERYQLAKQIEWWSDSS